MAEAIIKDAIAYATRSRRTDLVLMDDHIATLVRIAARAPRGLPEDGIEARLWRRVTERAEVLRAGKQSRV